MRKIRLDIEELTAESFDTADRDEKKAGTVQGHAYTQHYLICPRTSVVSCNPYTDGHGACIDPYC
jgi:hypothetical protein